MKFAYITLVNSQEYVIGAIALARSLRSVEATAPLIVMVVPGSCEYEPLIQEGCIVKVLAAPDFSAAFKERHARQSIHTLAPFDKGNKPAFHNPLNNFCKLNLWTFTDYDKLVFLDADTLVIKNIDSLFSFPEFSAAPNVYDSLDGFHRLNSGVFTAKPSLDTYRSMLKKLDSPGAFWPRTDQTFLQDYWPQWHGLPYTFNALQYLYIHLPELWNWDAIKVIHYQYEKPWQEDNPKRDQLKPLIDLWWSIYNEDKNITLTRRLTTNA